MLWLLGIGPIGGARDGLSSTEPDVLWRVALFEADGAAAEEQSDDEAEEAEDRGENLNDENLDEAGCR